MARLVGSLVTFSNLRRARLEQRARPHSKLRPGALAAVLALAMLAAAAPGQRPSVAPTRLAEGTTITIDGVLDEPAWRTATQLGRLTQVEPVAGAAPNQPTTVRLAYDRDYLYIALWCDEEPGLVRARLMDRDANLDPDDRVEFWIDPFNAQRFAYWFQIGAGGSRGDALVSDGGSRFNKRWDGIWYGRSRVTKRGWQAEVAVPFKTLGFRAGTTTWGFNLRRERRAAAENLRWASPDRAYFFFNIAVGGELTGLTGMDQGIGLDVVPYAKLSSSRDRRVDKHTSRTGDFGLDLSYRITPSLGFLLTYNTDFAETEVDERRVNLTRFPLFFPEKRDFFLQDSDLFEFGIPSGFRGRPRVVPFFSRRIGRDDAGNPVPILAGAKLTGRIGDWNIGALGTLLDQTALDEEKGLGVLRVAHNIGEESSIGMIATGGRPVGPGDALTSGVDFRFADQELLGPGRAGTLTGFWVASQNEGGGGSSDGDAWGLRGQLRAADWQLTGSAEGIATGFDPELGFVLRTGIRRYSAEANYTWRSDGGFVREIEFEFEPELVTTAGNEKDSWRLPFQWFRLELQSQDSITLETRRLFERVPAPFEIHDGIMVSAADYTDTRHRLNLRTSNDRLLSARLSVEHGDFFSGNLTRTTISPMLIPSRYLRVSGSYQTVQVRLDEGSFTTRITEARLDASLSPDVSWRNLAQYDTDSKDLTLQTRLRWILAPGQDLFLLGVYGWNRVRHAAPLIPTTQDLTVKLAYTVRF